VPSRRDMMKEVSASVRCKGRDIKGGADNVIVLL